MEGQYLEEPARTGRSSLGINVPERGGTRPEASVACSRLRVASALSPMTTIRRFVCNDLLSFNNVNLDPLTETARPPRHPLLCAR